MSPGMPSMRKQCQNNETYVMDLSLMKNHVILESEISRWFRMQLCIMFQSFSVGENSYIWSSHVRCENGALARVLNTF